MAKTREWEAGRQRREEARLAGLDRAASAPSPALPEWRISAGDCAAGMSGLREGVARLVFADPPYNVGIDYGGGAGADLLPPAAYAAWARGWVALSSRLLTPDGSLWVLCPDELVACYLGAVEAAGLTVRNLVKWYETFGVNCARKFNRTSRIIVYAVRSPRRFVFNREAVSRPSARQSVYNDPRASPGGKVLDDVWLDIPRLAGTHAERIPGFPTQLPLALLRRIVGCASNPGDLVIDPFNGSGTTGVAALESGRRYVGFDRSEKFVEIARKRLLGVTPALAGSGGGRRS